MAYRTWQQKGYLGKRKMHCPPPLPCVHGDYARCSTLGIASGCVNPAEMEPPHFLLRGGTLVVPPELSISCYYYVNLFVPGDRLRYVIRHPWGGTPGLGPIKQTNASTIS